MRLFLTILCLCATFVSSTARAEIVIEVTEAAREPVAIAVVPFFWQSSQREQDLSNTISRAMGLFGDFSVLARSDLISLPATGDEVLYDEWQILGIQYLLVGEVVDTETAGEIEVRAELIDVIGGRVLKRLVLRGPAVNPRIFALRLADRAYLAIHGKPGPYSTRLAYVGHYVGRQLAYELRVASLIGDEQLTVFRSNEPILSPDWSPDGRHLVYVTFEQRRPMVVLHDLFSGKRKFIAQFRGTNSAPNFSPDGNRIAMALSKDGDFDIYVYHLDSGEWVQLTNDPGIDTEPVFAADGRSLFFTSNRVGDKPQIYRYDLRSGEISLVTTEGNYNARARIVPHSNHIVYVHQDDAGAYRIALQDLKTNEIKLISDAALDEGPCVSPNGEIIIYATKFNDRALLAGVTLSLGSKFRLPPQDGQIKEPDWSNLIN